MPDPRCLLATLAQLENLRDPRKYAGLRRFKRVVVRGDAELQPVEQSRLDRTPVPVQLRDIGWGGLGFICQQNLPVGSVWRVCFLNHGYIVGEQAAMVRHCRQVMEGVYLVGAQFCIESGLLHLIGVEPADATEPDQADGGDTTSFTFVPPADVA